MRRDRIHQRRAEAFEVQKKSVQQLIHEVLEETSDLSLMFEDSKEAESLAPLYAVYSGHTMTCVHGNVCYMKE